MKPRPAPQFLPSDNFVVRVQRVVEYQTGLEYDGRYEELRLGERSTEEHTRFLKFLRSEAFRSLLTGVSRRDPETLALLGYSSPPAIAKGAVDVDRDGGGSSSSDRFDGRRSHRNSLALFCEKVVDEITNSLVLWNQLIELLDPREQPSWALLPYEFTLERLLEDGRHSL